MPQQPRVFVVDDDPAVRDSLRMLLRSAGFEAEAFDSAEALLQETMLEGPGCIIADYRMPGMTGIELQLELTRRGCNVPIIVISAYGDVPTAVEAMSEGAFTFIEKPFKDDVLIGRVEEAIRLSRRRVSASSEANDAKRRLESLTRREHEVLCHVIEGRSSREIGSALDVSHRTVEVHRANIMRKMNARSLPDLVRMALQAGTVSNPNSALEGDSPGMT